MKKNIILLIIFTLFLSSCWSEEIKTENESDMIVIETEQKTDTLKIEPFWLKQWVKDWEVKYDEEKEKLYIWDKVEINSWLAETFPEEIKIYKDNKTYINSNVGDYIFFVTDGIENINDISSYYTSLFNDLWYTQINNEVDDNEEEEEVEKVKEISRYTLEFVIKNKAYKEPVEWEIQDEELKYNNRVIVNINSSVPENIEIGMGLKWNFVEIYYNQINN